MNWLAKRRERRAERALHNEQDFHCKYWTGDRAGYDLDAKCTYCRSEEKK